MKFTILHISDLHRDPSNPISNSALLDSLERDRARYRAEHPAIADPTLIIVSGDIIYGVSANAKNPDEELAKQYEQAETFLGELANAFFGGDRSRIIIVPGNHDVSFSHTMRSTKRIDPSDTTAKLILQNWLENDVSNTSVLRWSWKDLCFYEIVDQTVYSSRLQAFSVFYERFYSNGTQYGLEPEKQFALFDYPDLNVSVAALSSCAHNDPLNRQGLIHPECIAGVANKLRQGQYSNRIRMAVWHHNTNGPPLRTDYLDSAVLQVLIDSGFSIGFHGHQHKPQFIDERFQFGSNRKITLISAGTLCAGPKALPPGQDRAYNLIQIETDSFRATLHTRTMQNEAFELPIWAPGYFTSSMKNFVEFDVQRPIRVEIKPIVEIGKAEALIRTKHYTDAIPLLKPLLLTTPAARRLLLECYATLEMTKELTEHYYPPKADNEIIYVADALWAEKKKSELQKMFSLDIVRNSTNPSVIEIVSKYRKRLK